MVSPTELLATYVGGAILLGSTVMILFLHYYSMRASDHFRRAEARLKHAKVMVDEADSLSKTIRKHMGGKASARMVESRISKAVTDLLEALEEEEKAVSVNRKKR